MNEQTEKLQSPPVVEALCEFRFIPSERWDWTLPGRLYDKIRTDFPERAQVNALSMHIEVSSGESPNQKISTAPERIQFKKSDGSSMVQMGPHLLVVNQLPPYPHWEGFRTVILNIMGEFIQLYPDFQLARIGLRYINRISLPEEVQDLGQMISVPPPLTGALQRPLKGFYQRYELQHEEPRGILIHQTGIQTTTAQANLIIDLDFGSTELESVVNLVDIEAWLNRAHYRVYESFVDSLNPMLYKQMKRGEL